MRGNTSLMLSITPVCHELSFATINEVRPGQIRDTALSDHPILSRWATTVPLPSRWTRSVLGATGSRPLTPPASSHRANG